MTRAWTTPADIAARVRRRWDDGALLRALAGAVAFDGIEVPLRGPKPSEIGDDVAAVRDWVAQLDAGRRDDRRYTLVWQGVGGRRIGRNQVPVRAAVRTLDQAWALLGVRPEVARFEEVLALVAGHPAMRGWVCDHPYRALALHDDMPRLVSAYTWLDGHRGSGLYLRQINARGVDTKFAEQHRGVLAAMLGVSSSANGFLAGLGLRAKPQFVRVRPAPSLVAAVAVDDSVGSPSGPPTALSELAVRTEDVAGLAIDPRRALVIENEITYLSVDVPTDGVVIWGKGFDVDRVGRLPWLAGAEVDYWGDVDTHGFAILDRLRAWLPDVRSVLMDRATLLAHRDRWVVEERPTHAALTRLTRDERDLYSDLVSDRFGDRVRLEQERIDWSWATQRL